ncbi:hypothetical protein NDU88_001882 [Pleurodeles waltl]|uniref:Uncharacterized protein n=1 Tax=Pleurodeles waltl TaxID=8319 RepID=A0AAV7MNX9_PLEWA|nr:hypothetical protein NDU88_001882 [Pleurodeles waltl]
MAGKESEGTCGVQKDLSGQRQDHGQDKGINKGHGKLQGQGVSPVKGKDYGASQSYGQESGQQGVQGPCYGVAQGKGEAQDQGKDQEKGQGCDQGKDQGYDQGKDYVKDQRKAACWSWLGPHGNVCGVPWGVFSRSPWVQNPGSGAPERPHLSPWGAPLQPAQQPRELRVAVCPSWTEHAGRGERAGPSRERSLYLAEHNPRSGRPLQAHGLGLGAGAASPPPESAPPLRQSDQSVALRDRIRGPRHSCCGAGRRHVPMGPAREPRPPRHTSASPETAARSSLPKCRSQVWVKRCRRPDVYNPGFHVNVEARGSDNPPGLIDRHKAYWRYHH